MKEQQIELKEVEVNHLEGDKQEKNGSWQQSENSLLTNLLKRLACNPCSSQRMELGYSMTHEIRDVKNDDIISPSASV